MKRKEDWQRHLIDLVGTSHDPTHASSVYAVQWARDPRCLQRGTGHRRVGAFDRTKDSICRLWFSSLRNWR